MESQELLNKVSQIMQEMLNKQNSVRNEFM